MLMTEYATSGQLYDFNCFDTDGNVWKGSAFVAWADGDYLAYRVPATEAGTSGRFTATAPTGTARWEMRLRGATLAISYVVGASYNFQVIATNAATAATQATAAAIDAARSVALGESDENIELRSGAYSKVLYQRGTNTELLPIKPALQPGGDPLTNPATQQLAGFRETP